MTVLTEDENFLAHYGVKGMRWGKRSTRPEGVSRKVDRAASKDAKEFTQAKMYYGDGAGTRRKLIKNSVESKSKDPNYKKAFDAHVAKTDMGQRVSQAQSKRKRTDTVEGAKKTGRGVIHTLKGNPQYASAAATVVVAGAVFAHKAGVDKMLMNAGKTAVSKAKAANSAKLGREFLKGL